MPDNNENQNENTETEQQEGEQAEIIEGGLGNTVSQRSDGKDIATLAREYATDLYNWYVLNPQFWSGTIQVIGHHVYKIGDRLLYKSKRHNFEMEFFIEGVRHEYVYGSHWVTYLSVTRGLPNAGAARFLEPVGYAQEYQGGGVGDPDPDTVLQMAQQEMGGLASLLGIGGIAGGIAGGLGMGVAATGLRGQVVALAQTYIGKLTYRTGGNRLESGAVDCSGFTYAIFKKFGIDIGGGSIGQWNKNPRKPLNMAQPGDLIFFHSTQNRPKHLPSHVGIVENPAAATFIDIGDPKGVRRSTWTTSYWQPKILGVADPFALASQGTANTDNKA